jgi:uncharacterized protein
VAQRTGFKPGEPSWVDLMTTDVDRAVEFYNGVFGWDATELPPEAGGYRMFVLDGKQVAGIGAQPADQREFGVPPTWNTYIDTADADATVAAAEAAGGKVILPPMDVLTAGRMAFVSDPAGAAIGLWQAGDHKGVELRDEPGTTGWIELLTPDPAAVTDFYARVFGWRARAQGEYTEFQLDGTSVAGMMAPPAPAAGAPPMWNVYFVAADVDHSAEVAADNGADTLVPPSDANDGHIRFSVHKDPQGAVFSLFRMNP